ncbi:MAG: radical SAM protein [Methanotrichaceae archaeon]
MAWSEDSIGSFYNYLPKGCEICRIGASLVLFVTGKCGRSCFYCPLSEERKGKDLAFADEQPVEDIEDIINEAKAIGALGTGITGGEPLLKLDQVLEYIRALKRSFGPEHHIHLYTGLLPERDVLMKLKAAGLDEIRFHPPYPEWPDPRGLKEALEEAKSLGLEAGVEIPAIAPAPEIINAVRDADAFMNINELEFSETNADQLKSQGYKPEEIHCGAIGSERIAREHFMPEGVKVHYCPSRFKDAVQLRERFKRRCERIARPFDIPTEDGTLICGTICGNIGSALAVLVELHVPEEMYSLKRNEIEISAPILEDISKKLKSIGCIVSLIERYPLEDGLVVERIPL